MYGCLFILGRLLSIAFRTPCVFAHSPAMSNGLILSPWEPLFNVSLSAYQCSTKGEGERKGGREIQSENDKLSRRT